MPECRQCGREFDRDPALEVECPKCNAEPGSPCRRPSGHPVNMNTNLHGIHADRDRKALREGVYEPCPEGPSGGDLEEIDLTYTFEDGSGDDTDTDAEQAGLDAFA